MNLAQAKHEIETNGFFRAPALFDGQAIQELKFAIEFMEKNDYTRANLERNAVYISDSTPTRVSHAMMCSVAPGSLLPRLSSVPASVLHLLEVHKHLVSVVSGKDVQDSDRVMFNFQRYFAGSKPVAEHFDGHYLRYEKSSGTSFKLQQGLLPRYVIVITLENANTEGQTGTVLREVATDKIHSPESKPGDLLIFDNIRFRHSVPELAQPRLMVGMRCFDAHPYLFDTVKHLAGPDAVEMPDSVNPGFIQPLTSSEGQALLADYYANDWPSHWAKIEAEGAVF